MNKTGERKVDNKPPRDPLPPADPRASYITVFSYVFFFSILGTEKSGKVSIKAVSESDLNTLLLSSRYVIMATAAQTSRAPLPLTTVFTPPASCSSASFVYLAGVIFVYPDYSQQPGGSGRAGCFPSGFQIASPFSPAPSLCPVGYEVACKTTSGEVTSAVCCLRCEAP